MGTFHSIDELIKTLDREKVLLKEMFAKRHSLQFRYDYALEMTEYKAGSERGNQCFFGAGLYLCFE